MENNLIHVEVAHALEGRQLILPVEAQQGITASEAIEQSGILQEFTDIDLGKSRLGIFGKERFHYWQMLLWTLFRRPGLFSLSITLAIYGHHFRKICNLHIS